VRIIGLEAPTIADETCVPMQEFDLLVSLQAKDFYICASCIEIFPTLICSARSYRKEVTL